MNAAMFIVSRMIMNNTGSDLMNMMNSLNLNTKAKKQPAQMKDPDINIETI